MSKQRKSAVLEIGDNQKRTEFNQAILEMIRKFSHSGSMQNFLDNVVQIIQRQGGCRYVGIRVLDESGHIPYQSYVGFSYEFWQEENMLQVSKEDCSCTRIISGNLLPCDRPVINEQGSLCINDTVAFAKTLADHELALFRGACMRWGYQSVAIVPIVYDQAIVGLFHLADPESGKIPLATVDFVEAISPLVGEVLSKMHMERHVRNIEQQKAMLENLIGGIGNLAYVVNLDTHELLYCQEQLFGAQQVGRKCYELFGFFAPCCSEDSSQGCDKQDSWEKYDRRRDRYYFAEQKAIHWFHGEMIRAAFVTDITVHRKTEKALKNSISELQRIRTNLTKEIQDRRVAQKMLREHTEIFRRKAMTDELTGLPNRACLNEYLAREMMKARRGKVTGSILFVDLDDLKMVNDTLGHKYGDDLILSAANLIINETGNQGRVARIGGDEFVIVTRMAERSSLAGLADRLVKVLRYDYHFLGMRLCTSASIGIAVYPSDGDTVEEILKNVDNAMNTAKRLGKNRWRFYETAMQKKAYEDIMLISSLRSALELDELKVVFQPQISVKNHKVVGFETLLRWVSPQHGFVPPLRFIPLAEKSGLIHEIGAWVIEMACRFVEKLNAIGGQEFRVAVNVSPHQLTGENFDIRVGEILERFDIRPAQLEMEITETALMTSMEGILQVLTALTERGIRLALDDFGTGYSSLNYLHCLPAQTLKIDKSFIDKIITNKMQASMIKNIVEMAHSMNLTVVAEGVETIRQFDFLAKNHCDLIQGYFFSKPLAEEVALRFFQEYN